MPNRIKAHSFFARRDWLALAWPLSAALLLAARCVPGFAERIFARRIFRTYRYITFVTGWTSFCFAEWVLYGFAAAVFTLLTLWVIHIIKGKGHRAAVLARGAADCLLLLGLVFFLFMLGSGGNYYRDTYAELSGLPVEPSSVEELSGLYETLTVQANTLREKLESCEDADGVFALPCDRDSLGMAASAAMEQLGSQEPYLRGSYPRPKAVLWSRQMSRFGITGVYFPFTVEANVNVDVAAYSLGAAMCHELSHVAGFMREDEANYLAYRACVRSGSDILAYSGTVLALIYTGNALYRADAECYSRIRSTFCAGLNRDLAADSAYWQQYEGTLASEVGEAVNDAYLKANHQSDGVRSYGAMVDLLLAEYRQAG